MSEDSDAGGPRFQRRQEGTAGHAQGRGFSCLRAKCLAAGTSSSTTLRVRVVVHGRADCTDVAAGCTGNQVVFLSVGINVPSSPTRTSSTAVRSCLLLQLLLTATTDLAERDCRLQRSQVEQVLDALRNAFRHKAFVTDSGELCVTVTSNKTDNANKKDGAKKQKKKKNGAS